MLNGKTNDGYNGNGGHSSIELNKHQFQVRFGSIVLSHCCGRLTCALGALECLQQISWNPAPATGQCSKTNPHWPMANITPTKWGAHQESPARNGPVITRQPGACAHRDQQGRESVPKCSAEPSMKILNKEGPRFNRLLNASIVAASSMQSDNGFHDRCPYKQQAYLGSTQPDLLRVC